MSDNSESRSLIGTLLGVAAEHKTATATADTIQAQIATSKPPMVRNKAMDAVPKWVAELARRVPMDPVELHVLLSKEQGVFSESAASIFRQFIAMAKLTSSGEHLARNDREMRRHAQNAEQQRAAWEAQNTDNQKSLIRWRELAETNLQLISQQWLGFLDQLESQLVATDYDAKMLDRDTMCVLRVLSERQFVKKLTQLETVDFAALRVLDAISITALAKAIRAKILQKS